MFKFTPQVWLSILVLVLLGLFLSPQISIPVEYKAFDWGINLFTTSVQQIDYANVQRSKTVKSGELEWVGLDFSLFGIESPLANFNYGAGLYPAHSVKFKAGLYIPSAFTQDVALVRNRIDSAGLTDIGLRTEVAGENAFVSFEFPANYTREEAQRLASLLISPGSLTFFERDLEAEEPEAGTFYDQLLPGFIPKPTLLATRDIANISVVNRTEYLLPVWELEFKESSQEKVAAVLGRLGLDPQLPANDPSQQVAGVPILSLEIDSLPQFALTYVSGTKFTAVPLGIIGTLSEVKIAASYILSDQPVASPFDFDQIVPIQNSYATEGRVMLGVFMLIVTGFSIYLLFRQRKVYALIAATLSLGMSLAIGLALLKLVANPLSIGLILSVLIMQIVNLLVINKVIESGEAKLRQNLQHTSQLAGLTFILAGIMYLSGAAFGTFHELIGVIAIMGASMFVAVKLSWHHIFTWYFDERNE